MWKRLKDKWKNKKGFGSIEIVISSLIVIMVVAGLVDTIQITQRLDTTSQAVGYVARVVQKQGGVQTKEIANYSGKYTTTSVLYNNVKSMMEANNIKDTEWNLYLKNGDTQTEITKKTNFPIINYGKRITVTLKVKYNWNTLSIVLPGVMGGTRESSRQVLSGYQIRDDAKMQTELNVE